jgi:hypothetical protein
VSAAAGSLQHAQEPGSLHGEIADLLSAQGGPMTPLWQRFPRCWLSLSLPLCCVMRWLIHL